MSESEQLNWNVTLQIPGGPTVVAVDQMSIAGYEKYRLAIAAGGTAIAPVGDVDGVHFVAIVPSVPDGALTFEVGAVEIKLDRAQIFAGEGAVSLVADAFPDISFDNGSVADVVIEVLIARV